MLSLESKIKLLAFTLGIFVSYTCLGVLHERIFRGTYYEDTRSGSDKIPGEKFTFSVGFVVIQCIVYSLVAKGVNLVRDQPKDKNETPQTFYLLVAIFYVSAMVTSNMALHWIPYPTQVIGKASKPILVMIFGVLIGKKSYTLRKYFFVIVIVISVGMFMMKDNYEVKEGEDYALGSLMIAISLLFDGLTSAFQDRMRADSRPSAMNFMLYVNSWSSAILISVLAVTGELRDLIQFSFRHPSVIWQLAVVILCGTFGQMFISAMITNFGSLPLSIVTTTRKFFTVLLSVLAFGNELSIRQWIAAGLMFSALMLDAIFGNGRESVEVNTEEVKESEIIHNNLKQVTIDKIITPKDNTLE